MVETSADGRVNPRHHRNPNLQEIGSGDGDVGNKPTTPSLSKPILPCNLSIPSKRRRYYYFPDESLYSEHEPPFKRVIDVSRWGNLRPPYDATSISNPNLICRFVENESDQIHFKGVSQTKESSDLSRWGTPRSPPTAMKSLRSGLAGSVGDGEAGRVEEIGKPAEIEVENNLEEESLSEISHVASLIIETADKEMWGQVVAAADRWVDVRFPCSDR